MLSYLSSIFSDSQSESKPLTSFNLGMKFSCPPSIVSLQQVEAKAVFSRSASVVLLFGSLVNDPSQRPDSTGGCRIAYIDIVSFTSSTAPPLLPGRHVVERMRRRICHKPLPRYDGDRGRGFTCIFYYSPTFPHSFCTLTFNYLNLHLQVNRRLP